MRRAVPPHSYWFLKIFLLWMVIFAAGRVAFWFLYGSAGPLPLVAWRQGLRFDAAATGMLLAPALLLSALRPFKRLWAWYLAIAQCLFLVWVLADLIYYPLGGKRLGYEAWSYFDLSLLPILQSAWAQNTAGTFGAMMVLTLMGWTFCRRVVRAPLASWPTWGSSPVFLLTAAAVILAVRGGVQRVPLRPGDANISSLFRINHAVINAPYQILHQFERDSEPRHMGKKEAEAIALRALKLQGQSVSPRWPLLREFPERKPNKWNVVVLLMESWSGMYTEIAGGDPSITPRFNQMAREGLVFPKFVSTGFRTTSGLFSVLTGFPDTLGVPIMRRPELANAFTSLPKLLKPLGYQNVFVHGGLLDFDHLNNLLALNDFDVVKGKGDLTGPPHAMHTWGWDDEVTFSELASTLAKTPEPWFGWTLSVSTHTPYTRTSKIPDLLNAAEEAQNPDGPFLNALHYSDGVLGQFIDEMRNLPSFPRTVFVITGDHSHHGEHMNAYENQHVPFLIWAPGLVKPKVSPNAGSHVNALPTLAELLGIRRVAAFGNSLLEDDKNAMGYYFNGLDVGLLRESDMIFTGLGERPAHALQLGDFPLVGRLKGESQATDSDKELLIALNQFALDLLSNNAVAPPAEP